jgi:hypothetical protein
LTVAALGIAAARGQSAGPCTLEVTVVDTKALPILNARVELKLADRVVAQADTIESGALRFLDLRPGVYALSVRKEGFDPFENNQLQLTTGFNQTTAALKIVTRTDSVEVRGTVLEVEETTSKPNTLPPEKAKELPSRPATVADVLPLTPGVFREPGGGLILSSSPENRAALIVNSADVTDPATGQFGLTVPIDSVEVLNVYQTAYLAEYGRFTSGLVSVETRRGGEKWKWELNDPLPEFRIRSYRLRGLKTTTPRLNFEGPLIANRLFVSQGLEFEIRKTAVYTLPFPYNQKKTQGFNSFSQLDWIKSDRHVITSTMHVAPQRSAALTLDYFNPLPVSPDGRSRNLTGTVTDRLSILGGLFENRFSVTDFDGKVWGSGVGPMVIAPAGNTGSYFADQGRAARRISGNSSFSFAPLTHRGWGNHQIKIGVYLAGSDHSGDIFERPIEIVDQAGHLLTDIQFPRTRNFDVDDLEKSFYAQDHWILTSRLAIDIGVRSEAQQISGAVRIAPRTGFSWTPLPALGTVFRGGAGYFYDRVPLNVYAFNRYPGRVVTLYDGEGNIIDGPSLFVNTLGQSRVARPFISQSPTDGNFSPRSLVWSGQAEQPLGHKLRVRATFLKNTSDGLVVLNRVPVDPATGLGAYLLEGAGVSNYRQFDITGQFKLRSDRQLFFSYVHSHAEGDLNDFSRFLGTVPNPLIRLNQRATLGTDLPDRFLTWGVFRLPQKFQIAPVFEYRNGLPYLVTDANQRYVGIPNSRRFPNFFSLDSRFSKDFQVNPKYSVRFSVSSFNLTNHFNPEQVHSNIGDPAFGYFFGHRGRRFTLDFDFLF